MTDISSDGQVPGDYTPSVSTDSSTYDLVSGHPQSSKRKKRREPKTPLQGFLFFVRDVVVILLVALLVSFVVKTFLIRSFYIPSASMEQTLQINDRVIVNELVPGVMPIQRGDVIVFKDPGGWLLSSAPVDNGFVGNAVEWVLSLVGLASQDSNEHLIKRVIGLPGDTVACCTKAGMLTINGVPVKEPYVSLPSGQTRVSSVNFKVTVPAKSLWVMGDNRYNSMDSRFNTDKPGHGFVSFSDVVGRAFVVSWPVARWSWLSNYSDTFANVPSVAVNPTANTIPSVSSQ